MVIILGYMLDSMIHVHRLYVWYRMTDIYTHVVMIHVVVLYCGLVSVVWSFCSHFH